MTSFSQCSCPRVYTGCCRKQRVTNAIRLLSLQGQNSAKEIRNKYNIGTLDTLWVLTSVWWNINVKFTERKWVKCAPLSCVCFLSASLCFLCLSACLPHIIPKSAHRAWPSVLCLCRLHVPSTCWLDWTGTELPSSPVFRLKCGRTAWGILIIARCNKNEIRILK